MGFGQKLKIMTLAKNDHKIICPFIIIVTIKNTYLITGVHSGPIVATQLLLQGLSNGVSSDNRGIHVKITSCASLVSTVDPSQSLSDCSYKD